MFSVVYHPNAREEATALPIKIRVKFDRLIGKLEHDALNARRAAAQAGDKCFSQGRLRDEFRMKPAPGMEPVRWYKSGYGSKYGVYRIADCVPLREKQPRTEKQRLADARLVKSGPRLSRYRNHRA